MATLDERDIVWRRELEREIRQLAPHWEDPEADWTWVRQVMGATQRPRRAWGSWAPYGAAAGLAGMLVVFGLLHRPVSSPAISPAVLATVTREASAVLNQPRLRGYQVAQPAPDTVVLTNTKKTTRWEQMTFRRQLDGQWLPITLQSRIAGISVTFTVVTGQPGFVLPVAAQRRVESRINALPYSALDTQQGALGRLPINLAGAHFGRGVGQAKVDLHLPGIMIRALTYVNQVHGHTVFYPIGWYWMTGGPSFLALPLTAPVPQGNTTTGSTNTVGP